MAALDPEIHIRKLIESDRDWICSLLSNSLVTYYLPFDLMNREEGEERVDSYLKLNAASTFSIMGGTEGAFVATDEESGKPMGYAFLRPYTWEKEFTGIEIGYLIDPEFWGKGVASRLAQFCVSYFNSRIPKSTETLLALIDDENLGSQKVVTSVGFKRFASSIKYRGNSIWML